MPETISLEKAEKILSEVHPDKEFRLHLGANIVSLYELSEALDIISDVSFNHHITKHKNDFANWVRHVVGDKKLAHQIENMKKRKDVNDAVKLRIKELEGLSYHSMLGEEIRAGAREFIAGIIIGFIAGIMVHVLVG